MHKIAAVSKCSDPLSYIHSILFFYSRNCFTVSDNFYFMHFNMYLSNIVIAKTSKVLRVFPLYRTVWFVEQLILMWLICYLSALSQMQSEKRSDMFSKALTFPKTTASWQCVFPLHIISWFLMALMLFVKVPKCFSGVISWGINFWKKFQTD